MFRFALLLPLSLALGCANDLPSVEPPLEEPSVDPLAGLQDSDLLSSIDADLWQAICDEFTADLQEQSFVCDGVEITVPALTSEACQIGGLSLTQDAGDCGTYGQWSACVTWIPDEPCTPGDPPAECMALADCVAGSG